ncbi:hypothetical protein E9840_03485 [Tissierella creatinini]|nr:hypothetical protein E9840_03485 [Tissierella creatinini]TJX63237.1 hypothetical protein E8P77_15405 [Soehngenia saccharolytica]
MSLQEPHPIYNQKEEILLKQLTQEYSKFIEPNKFNRQLELLSKKAINIVPDNVKDFINDKKMDISTEEGLYQELMKVLGSGFEVIERIVSNSVVTEKKVLKDIQKKYPYVDTVDKITFVRSYDIQKIVNSKTKANYVQAFVEGAATGAPGVVGLPFNILLSTFLYYRVVQNIAMHYGYDVNNDPKELEFAGEVFITAFTHGTIDNYSSTGAIIGKIMMQGELTALKANVNKLTLKQLAEQGGAQLIYVQIRALAHKVANDALKSAGKKGMERSIFKNILKVIGKNLPKSSVKKTVPVIGGIVGALFDTSYMDRVIKGANLIYHKRFLLEKETRIKLELDHIQGYTDTDFDEYIESSSINNQYRFTDREFGDGDILFE